MSKATTTSIFLLMIGIASFAFAIAAVPVRAAEPASGGTGSIVSPNTTVRQLTGKLRKERSIYFYRKLGLDFGVPPQARERAISQMRAMPSVPAPKRK